MGFGHGLPFFDHRARFVTVKIHAMEARQLLPWISSVISLNFLKATSSFCRSARLTSTTTLQTISCDFVSLCPHDQCSSNTSYIEHSWCFHITPIFPRTWIHHFLLGSLFAAFHWALVLAHRHGAAQRAKRALQIIFKQLLWTTCFEFYK